MLSSEDTSGPDSARSALPCNTHAVSEAKKILDAHVEFELARWTGESRDEQLTEEVAAAFAWLKTVRLNQLFTSAEIVEWCTRYSQEFEVTDQLLAMIGSAARSAYVAASKDDTRIGDLIPEASYDQVASAVLDMQELREMITTQVTTSEVYSRLMSHVVYQAIKSYLQEENLIARKVPGASTLMKMGQSAISTAAPKLEKAVDKQLTAFVNANIQDNIRDSKRYLDKVLDKEVLTVVTNEVWDTNAKSTVAEMTNMVPVDAIDEFTQAGRDAWLHLRTNEFLTSVLSRVVEDFLKQQGKRKVADILADAGVTPELATNVVIDLTGPVIDKAVADGYFEARIRARLEPFYADYFG